MIIDCHTYCIPKRLATVKLQLPPSEQHIINAIYKHSEGEYALSLAQYPMIQRSMEEAGISKTALVSLPWNSHELCIENSEYILELSHQYNDLYSIPSIQPKAALAIYDVERFIKYGAIGLKVNPFWQEFDILSDRLSPIIDLIVFNNRFLMLHIDHPFNFSNSSTSHLFSLAKKYPNLKILATHMGGLLGIYNLHPPVREVIKNIWFDTAISSTLKMVSFYIDCGLQDRIIFGSDFPFNHSHEQKQLVIDIKGLIRDETLQDKIFYKNFMGLTGNEDS